MSDKKFHESCRRDPRSATSKKMTDNGSQSRSRHSRGTDSDNGKGKRRDVADEDSDADHYSYDKLKKFHIPRKKSREEKGESVLSVFVLVANFRWQWNFLMFEF